MVLSSTKIQLNKSALQTSNPSKRKKHRKKRRARDLFQKKTRHKDLKPEPLHSQNFLFEPKSSNVQIQNGSQKEKTQRRRQIDPTTCERDYTTDEIEFMNALDSYKRNNGRMFPTCSEILEVIKSLGYVKQENSPEQQPNIQPDEHPSAKMTSSQPATPFLISGEDPNLLTPQDDEDDYSFNYDYREPLMIY